MCAPSLARRSRATLPRPRTTSTGTGSRSQSVERHSRLLITLPKLWLTGTPVQMERRSANECRMQWLYQDHPLIKKSKWTKQEILDLHKVADARGRSDWAAVAQDLGVSCVLVDPTATHTSSC